jgi:hypothetical protein
VAAGVAVKGSIVVGEHVLPVTDVELTGGTVRMRVLVVGPIDACDSVGYTLHGDDGHVIMHVPDEPMEWPAQGPGDMLSIVIDLIEQWEPADVA